MAISCFQPDGRRDDSPLADRLERIETKLDELLALVRNPVEARSSYSAQEVAAMLGVTEPTVRLWCRQGRIEASRRCVKRGGAERWSIAAAEVTRHKDEGLLPTDPSRNAGR